MKRAFESKGLSALLREIAGHAIACHPDECCGFVLGRGAEVDAHSHYLGFANAQDEFHRLDPDQFPRTARNAFFIHPRDLFEVERRLTATGEQVQWIVHSHPDADAYFSTEDERCAAPDGVPLHPDADHVVVGCRRGGPVEFARFRWNATTRSHVELERRSCPFDEI